MKKFTSIYNLGLIALLSVSVLFYACEDEASAQKAADEFLTALKDGELDKAKEMVEENSEKLIKTIEKTADKIKKSDAQINIIEEESDGNTSVVKFRYDDDSKVQVLRLNKKDDGEWNIKLDGDSEDILVGDETIEDIISDLDIDVDELLELSETAINELVKSSGSLLKIASSILSKAGDILKNTGDSISINSKEFEEYVEKFAEEHKIDFEKAKEDLLKAKEEIEKAAQELNDK